MEHELSPDDPRHLLGAYAIGALDADDAARVEALVLDDHEARAELHALQLGGSWLSTADAQPAAHVWERIAQEIEEPAAIVPIDRARARQPRRVRAWAVAAAVVVAVGGVIATVGGSDGTRSVEAAAQAAAADPSSRTYSLDAAGGERRVDVVVTADGTGYVTADTLPALAGDETYQLWAITPQGPVSAAVLGRDPGVHAFDVPDDAQRLAITDEPRGGSDQPTGIVLASTALA